MVPLGRGSVAGRCGLERRTIHLTDVLADPEYERADLQRLQDDRTALAVPMLRESDLLGVLVIHRSTVEPFNQRNIELVTTFADQAVIAIENVRLFTELQERTADLSRSVDELRALGEISRAVGSTLDQETVLRTIVAHAAELSGAHMGIIYEYDEAPQEFQLRAKARGPALVSRLTAAARSSDRSCANGSFKVPVATSGSPVSAGLIVSRANSACRSRCTTTTGNPWTTKASP